MSAGAEHARAVAAMREPGFYGLERGTMDERAGGSSGPPPGRRLELRTDRDVERIGADLERWLDGGRAGA